MTAGLASALYVGEVAHARLQPFRHAFCYRIFSLLVDLDELALLDGRFRLLSINRPGLMSFHETDHGDGGGGLRQWATARFQAAGLANSTAAIRLFCFPRLWNFVFNPLAVHFGYRADGSLGGLIYQVSNTFGERHSYVLRAATDQRCAKTFHVSPFFDVAGGYRFELTEPGDTLSITIHHDDVDGRPLLVARQAGVRHAMSDAALLRAVLGNPLMTLKVVGGIHWEALRLWRKGARYRAKPAPPARDTSWIETATDQSA